MDIFLKELCFTMTQFASNQNSFLDYASTLPPRLEFPNVAFYPVAFSAAKNRQIHLEIEWAKVVFSARMVVSRPGRNSVHDVVPVFKTNGTRNEGVGNGLEPTISNPRSACSIVGYLSSCLCEPQGCQRCTSRSRTMPTED